jgi:hypothetical protein
MTMMMMTRMQLQIRRASRLVLPMMMLVVMTRMQLQKRRRAMQVQTRQVSHLILP